VHLLDHACEAGADAGQLLQTALAHEHAEVLVEALERLRPAREGAGAEGRPSGEPQALADLAQRATDGEAVAPGGPLERG
jgi:hypothetical protein